MITINTEPLPIKLWLDDIEPGALAQAKNLANLPFAFKWIAIMPDSHQGFGMPIGGVLATRDVIVPNAVGVDIGCGMCTVRTSLREMDRQLLKSIMGSIRESVPLGFNHHPEKQAWTGFDNAPDLPVIQRELDGARYQLGTLGGGNHFIEVQKGDDGCIWIMLHSGSRNFGLKIANEYHELATRGCSKGRIALPDKDLAYLDADSREGRGYLAAMTFALAFAKENRLRMMAAVMRAFEVHASPVSLGEVINIHHNYAVLERHYHEMVFVHRKGATSAREGETGLIPGSQGTKSYVVRGKGNPESFMSCSHGAGRRMGRRQAQRELDLAGEKKRLDDLGVVHGIRSAKDLDEAAGAYKDIDVVMRNQRDLVEIVTELSPMGVIKG